MLKESAAAPPGWLEGLVVTTTRRYITLTSDYNSYIQATASARALDTCVGDRVHFEPRDGGALVHQILPRRNQLVRQYRGEQKLLVSNLDRILIMTAVKSSFNSLFVDRVLAVANTEGIACTLVVNKIDQGLEETKSMVDLYVQLGLQVLCISAKFGTGLESVNEIFCEPRHSAVALVGISGVGKTTLLNRFVPDARSRTAEVNERTGLGRQTTSQAIGHIFPGERSTPLLVVDTPGLQSFGIAHLTHQQVADSFPEIVDLRGQCEFSDCRHIAEQVCAVRTAFEEDRFSATRYRSYIHMIEEIDAAKPY